MQTAQLSDGRATRWMNPKALLDLWQVRCWEEDDFTLFRCPRPTCSGTARLSSCLDGSGEYWVECGCLNSSTGGARFTRQELARHFGVPDVAGTPELVTEAPEPSELISGSDMLEDPDTAAWAVQGIAPEGGLGVLAGEGGVGKGWITLTLADAVGTGEKWLGAFDVLRSGLAIICDFERGRRYTAPRIKQLHAATGRVPEVHYIFRPPKYDAAWFRALIERDKPALLVIDSLTHLLPPGTKDTDNDAMAQVLGALRALAEEFCCCILIIHHFRKRGEFADSRPVARVKGAVAIVNTADVVFAAWKTKQGTVRVEAVKSYWGDAAEPFLCDWVTGENGGTAFVYAGPAEPEKLAKIDLAKEAILAAVEIEPQTREQLDARCRKQGVPQRTVTDALRDLRQADRVRRSMDGKTAVFALPA